MIIMTLKIMKCAFFLLLLLLLLLLLYIKDNYLKDVYKNFSFCLDEYLYNVLETKYL